jgi:hypothetical protein
MSLVTPEDRQAFISGLRDLADYLGYPPRRRHPGAWR